MPTIARRDIFWGWVSYALWGFFPIYWKLLHRLGPLEILAHRFIWSFVFYAGIFFCTQKRPLERLKKIPAKDLKLSMLSALVVGTNWGFYIYAVHTNRILEGSLAYFINPLLNVVTGLILFREAIPRLLQFAVASAAIGVAIKASLAPEPPVLALILASTFCLYGIIKKSLSIEASTTSLLEGATGIIPAILAAIYLRQHSEVTLTTTEMILMVGSGVVTGLPLFLFSYAAQRVPYSLMGILQFIAPTLQFAVGVWLYGEHFGSRDLLAFGFIWLGVIFYLGAQARKLAKLRIAT